MIRIILGVFLVFAGLSALLGFSLFKVLFALLLIIIGVGILSGRKFVPKAQHVSSSDQDTLNEVYIFSPINKKIISDSFKGGKAVMVFSGGELDLSQARTHLEKIDLEIVAVFGGGKLIVPRNWKISIEGAAIVGAYENKTDSAEASVVLNIKGAAVFGGVEIVN